MKNKFTILLTLFLVSNNLNAQNIKKIQGKTYTCTSVPVRYRIIFNKSCTNPSITNIQKANPNTSPYGYLLSSNFVTFGQTSDGFKYEDFDLVFGNTQYNDATGIDIIFESKCNGLNRQTKTFHINLTAPPSVSIYTDNGSFTFFTIPGIGGSFPYFGSKVFKFAAAVPQTSLLWTVTGSTFGIVGANNQSQVTVYSTTSTTAYGTLKLRFGSNSCEYVYVSVPITAIYKNIILGSNSLDKFNSNEKEIKAESIIVDAFPNPVKNTLSVKVIGYENLSASKIDILIFDVSMKVVKRYSHYKNSSVMDLNLSELSNGTYFLKVISDKEIITKKIIVQK